jgi:hypothetical protein
VIESPSAVGVPRAPVRFSAAAARSIHPILRAVIGATTLWLGTRVVLVLWSIVVQLGSPVGSRLFSHRDWPATLFFRWDSLYFAGISEHGYFGAASLATWPAFFPGYPAATRMVAAILGGTGPSTSTSAIAVSMAVVVTGASLVATILFWLLVSQRSGTRIALAATVLFVAGPYSLFLVASYSEALFLAFALGAWLLAGRGYWLPAGILAAGASLTRANGVFLIVALVVLYVMYRRSAGAPYLLRAVALAALGFCGVGGYFLYLFARTGDPQAWTHAENLGWQRAVRPPWETLWNTADVALHSHYLATRQQSTLEIIFAALFVVALVVLIRRRMWAEATLLGITLLSLMTSSTYMSLARTSVVLFPLPILIASTLSSPRRKWVYGAAVIVGGTLLLFNTRQFALGLWSD